MDSMIVFVLGERHIFITAIDVVTKYAVCIYAKTVAAAKALELLTTIHQLMAQHSVSFKLTMAVIFLEYLINTAKLKIFPISLHILVLRESMEVLSDLIELFKNNLLIDQTVFV